METGGSDLEKRKIVNASNLLAMASNLRAMASNLIAMASNLVAMASNLVAMACNLEAMASKLIGIGNDWKFCGKKHRGIETCRLIFRRKESLRQV